MQDIFMSQSRFTMYNKTRIDNLVFNSKYMGTVKFLETAVELTFKSRGSKPVTFVLPSSHLTTKQTMILQSNKRKPYKNEKNNDKLSKRPLPFKKRNPPKGKVSP